MLVLSRKLNETIQIDENIKVTVLEIRGNKVRLGIEAPDEVGIVRGELIEVEIEQPNTHTQPLGKTA